ncbi:MAG: Xaa-Pro peptidase family protein [Desulfovibrionaceae bacterium]|nr:Xaa-Pro peptidase family protein [Desulfovibrionaceae bacterium]
MGADLHAARRGRARLKLAAGKLDALLVTLDANRYYLSGFELHDPQSNESCGCLILFADGEDWLCTDPRYEEAAGRIWPRDRLLIYQGSASAPERLNEFLRGRLKGPLGLETGALSLACGKILSRGLRVRAADGLVESLRMIKDAEEIARMRAASDLNNKLMDLAPDLLTPGRSEKDIAWEIERFYRQNGAEELSFQSIVGIGSNAALPHARPGEDLVRENVCVLIDCGCRVRDYCSDQTRTFWVGGRPPALFRKALDQVMEAQRLAIRAIRPGVSCKEVYAVVQDYFEDLGVFEHFNHGLGHGIGLQTHEPPALNSRNETLLEPGMITSVEPGLYYPEWGGARWERLVLVTEDGCEAL